MKNGTVKFFDATKGFGFIKDHAGEGDFFVHITGTLEPIADGDEVEFELKEEHLKKCDLVLVRLLMPAGPCEGCILVKRPMLTEFY